MKLLLLISLAILALAHAEVEQEHEYMYFPDGEGNVHLIDLKQKVPESASSLERTSSIFFQLFTVNNPTNAQILTLNDVNSIVNSNWVRGLETRFVTHGWRSSSSSDACTVIRDAYLAAGHYNVIVVDWSQIAGQDYVSAAASVTSVASHVAQMINFLEANGGLNPWSTIVVGHSLGGHIAGLSARGANGVIGGVISLDPAMPLFQSASAGSRVDASDANHVQVIHTNGGLLGLSEAVGDSDFYPNGGSSQPGCGLDLVGSCAHSRAYYFTAESIRNPTAFPATVLRSSSLDSFLQRNTVYMGGRYLSTHARGSYTLTTAASSPYGLG